MWPTMHNLVLQVTATLGLATLLAGLAMAAKNPDHAKLARLFDYESYKQTFGKNYSSSIEDSTRRSYFYARALNAFVSGVNFKYRNADHYLALNEMSDWTPEERAKVRGRRRRGVTTSGTKLERAHQEQLPPFMPAKGENPEETLRKFLEIHADHDPKYRDLLIELSQDVAGPRQSSDGHRRKRSADGGGARDFSFDMLIKSADEVDSRGVKQVVAVASNNPNYQGIELMTRGLSDQLEEVDFSVMKPPEVELGSLERQLESSLGSARPRRGRNSTRPQLADEIFFDHRDSGCLSAVRNQGTCGSCYAFASIAIAEWLYCMQHDKLVAFSEQYMVDCGKGRLEGMDGCDGAIDRSVVEFIHNFGLELRRNYPYLEREDTCPYDEGADLRTAGYIRMELAAFTEVPLSLWPKVLQEMPLYVLIEMDDAFLDYGGGVYDGSSCRDHEGDKQDDDDDDDDRDFHAMVLVGHGREDGQEYWLIRNSHGPSWGERGYYKLAKGAPVGCIPDQVAYAFGSNKVRPRKNRHYDESVVAPAKSRGRH